MQLFALVCSPLAEKILRGLPVSMRKINVDRLLRGRPHVIFVNPFESDAIGPYLSVRVRHGRSDRTYLGGRSKDWIKDKNRKHPAIATCDRDRVKGEIACSHLACREARKSLAYVRAKNHSLSNVSVRSAETDGEIMTILDVICPVYREEEVIASFHARLAKTLDILSDRYTVHITYVVDPSPDRTEEILSSIGQIDKRVAILTMSRRFGHQMALVAGIDHSDGDIIVMLDSDLQHPPELIPELLRHWEEGSEIVQTIRTDGAEINWLKRLTSRWFYAAFTQVGAVNLQPGAADYRLISRRVAEVFRKEIREHNQFLRGLVSWVGYRISFVQFTPVEREQGRSKYRPATLLNFALNGICSFSKVPLRFCIGAGFTLAALSLLAGLVQILIYAIGSVDVPGWTSLIAMVSFASGVQLFFLGVLGEYVSLIFDEVKDRPLYLLDRQHRRAGARRDDADYDSTMTGSSVPHADLTLSQRLIEVKPEEAD